MPLYKNCGWWKHFDCIFGFSVKSYVRNTINLSWTKILLGSVINNKYIPTQKKRKRGSISYLLVQTTHCPRIGFFGIINWKWWSKKLSVPEGCATVSIQTFGSTLMSTSSRCNNQKRSWSSFYYKSNICLKGVREPTRKLNSLVCTSAATQIINFRNIS
jgi:hypothetical protein